MRLLHELEDHLQSTKVGDRAWIRAEFNGLIKEIDALRAEVNRLHDKYDHQLLVKENARLKEELAEERNDSAEDEQYIQRLKAENKKLRAVADAARSASKEIQAQKVVWPGEVDTLKNALAALDQNRGDMTHKKGEPKISPKVPEALDKVFAKLKSMPPEEFRAALDAASEKE